eukprot:678931-Hanusia_phi.AAC.2
MSSSSLSCQREFLNDLLVVPVASSACLQHQVTRSLLHGVNFGLMPNVEGLDRLLSLKKELKTQFQDGN